MNIELTTQQADNLLKLLDIAIKAGGYSNAKPAVELIDLIIAAAQPNPKAE